MADVADKVREDRIRRAASRLGYRLEKSRRRNPGAIGYGTFWLVDRHTGNVATWGPGDSHGHGYTLDAVEKWLGE